MLEKIRAVDAAEEEFARAKLGEARKDFNGAEQHLRRAAELAPKSVGRVLDVARFLARRGRFNESVTWLGWAETMAPKSPQVLFQTAQTYIEAKTETARSAGDAAGVSGESVEPGTAAAGRGRETAEAGGRRAIDE